MMAAERKRLEHALLLIARQHGGSTQTAHAAKEALARWRAQEPANEAAALAAQAAWTATDGQALQGELPLPASQAQRERQTRRRALSVLSVLGVAGLTGALGRWHWLQPLERLALHTGHGQQLSRQLADGSQLDLAPATEALVLLYRQRRAVHLTQGEIRLQVAHDASRPLEVLTPLGRVRVLGTVFSVALHGGSLQVRVAQGRVAVWRPGADADRAADAVLSMGEALRLDASGHIQPFAVNTQDVGAWREGWLVFDRTPLPEVVARWNDYLARPLLLAEDASLQSLRLTGSFKLREPATFVSSLPRSLPVHVEYLPDGRTVIQRR
ncbi:MAG: FecR domain-containing protein [Acidovorax sp.]|jgi:transmembrane sensor|nr:FecR domain-containing protein [Acidovorax sp.]